MNARGDVPLISPGLRRWFAWYARHYLKRHFNAVRLLREASPPPETSTPTVFFINHAAWWDPLVALHLGNRFYPNQRAFAPIDARSLEKYPFLKRLGFFPVDRSTARGARQFIRSATAILDQPHHALWLTPQGKFTDAHQRPVRFEAGLGHLAANIPGVTFIPIAIEYTWWFERSPEVLIAFGRPAGFPPGGNSAVFTNHCEKALTDTQDQLAAASQLRHADEFEILISGRAGIGGFYDLWRRFRAGIRGKRFTGHHSSDLV